MLNTSVRRTRAPSSSKTNECPFLPKEWVDNETSKRPKSCLNHVSLVSWNAHSINNTCKKLYINSFPQTICCIQETWGVSHSENYLGLDLSCSHFKNRIGSKGGGTLTWLKDEIHKLEEFQINKDTNLLKLLVHRNKIIYLCNCYLSQGKNTTDPKIILSHSECGSEVML